MTEMGTNPALNAAVLIALLAGSAISTARLALLAKGGRHRGSYLTDPEADAGHLVMNLAMAAMLAPWLRPGPRGGVVGVLALLVAAFAALLVKNLIRPAAGTASRRGSLAYHLFAAATMLYATAAMPAAMTHPGSARSAALTVIAVVFAVDALATAALVLAAPDVALAAANGPATAPASGASAVAAGLARDRTTLRIASVPHLAMDVAMALMLLGLT